MAAVDQARFHFCEVSEAVWTEATVLADVVWEEQTFMVPVSLTERLGPDPNELTVRVHQHVDYVTSYVGQAISTQNTLARRNDGTDADMPLPAAQIGAGRALKPFSLIRLSDAASSSVADRAAATTRGIFIFTGFALRSAPETEECLVTAFEIARWHMQRIAVTGMRLYRHAQDDVQWQPHALPHFNPNGRPNQRVDTSVTVDTRRLQFVPADLNSENGVQKNAGDYATFWRYGGALNSLRNEYNQAGAGAGGGTTSTANYLVWAEVTDATWPELFAHGGSDNLALDLPLGGLSLGNAVDEIITRAGQLDWDCWWDDAAQKYTLGLTDAVAGSGTDHDLTRGTLGGAVGATPPKVVEMDLQYSWENARNSILPLGARKRYEVTLDTVAGTLVKGWTAAAQTAYLAATEEQKGSTLYNNVLLKWQFAKNLNWSAFFGDNLHFDGARSPLAFLLSDMFATGADGSPQPVRVRAIIWRSTDGGTNWAKLPASLQAMLEPDGFTLPGACRKNVDIYHDNSTEYWTWDGNGGGPTIYDMRITLAVESDARLTSTTWPTQDVGEAEPTAGKWPTLETCKDMQDAVYEARRKAFLHTADGLVTGAVIPDAVSGSGDVQFGAAADDAIRDDTARLDASTVKLLASWGRPQVNGSLLLHTQDWDIQPGDRVGTLSGGGSRPSIVLNAVIGRVEHQGLDTLRPAQVLYFGANV